MSHVVIVGAGPAGACLAHLLAHRNIRVTLIERRRDFAREFRGEVLMPSGIQALQNMGLQSVLQEIPVQPINQFSLFMNGRLLFDEEIDAAAFRGQSPLAISQPALLEAVVTEAAASSRFELRRGVSVDALLMDSGRVAGVELRTEGGTQSLPADLVIGADGRNSVVRRLLTLPLSHASPPMDIVWCKLPCPQDWQGVRAFVGRGHLLVAYRTWDGTLQLGWVILKGTFGQLRSRGIRQWVDEMANHVSDDLAAHLKAHAEAAEKPFLLDTVSDCVTSWSAPGALVIGDAAHTMSPVAAQGVNIALRDAIVAANHLVPVLTREIPELQQVDQALRAIEAERMLEVAPIQQLQAQPPKVVLARTWWGEPVRRIIGALLSQRRFRERAAQRVAVFPFGTTDVKLKV